MYWYLTGLERSKEIYERKRQAGECSVLSPISPFIYKHSWKMEIQSNMQNGCFQFKYTCLSFFIALSSPLNDTHIDPEKLNSLTCNGKPKFMILVN